MDKIGETDPAKKEAILSGKSGQTKQQVIDTAKPPPEQKPAASVFCDRCRDNGPVKGCVACKAKREAAKGREPGDDTESEALARQRKGVGPRPGQVLFDWKAFRSDCDRVLRQIDKFGSPYNAHNTPQANGLRRLWGEFKKVFKTWAKEVSKITPPQD